MATANGFDLEISRDRLSELAPELLEHLREFVQYGLCRQANTFERKALAEKFSELAHATLNAFPDLKLNHCGAKTIIRPDVVRIIGECSECGYYPAEKCPEHGGELKCECCGEPAGEGGALCPACQESR